jgi:pilus assembly protein CpaB
VLAVGDATAAEPSNSGSLNTVTLELTPEQANILILAREKGEIALSYNPDGKGTGGVAAKNSERATMAEILGLEKAEASAPATHDNRALFTSEFFKGTKRTTLEFENHND